MANNIETTTTADIIFSPSEGESLDAYLSCMADSLSTLPENADVKRILSEGQSITLIIKGMPAKEEEKPFSITEYLDSKLSSFEEENPEIVTRLGKAALRDAVYGFFENMTDTPLRPKKALSQLANTIVKSAGI